MALLEDCGNVLEVMALEEGENVDEGLVVGIALKSGVEALGPVLVGSED